MDKFKTQLHMFNNGQMSESQFLTRIKDEPVRPKYDDLADTRIIGRSKNHWPIVLPRQRTLAVPRDVDHQWELVSGLIASQQSALSLNQGYLEPDEIRWMQIPLRLSASDISKKLRAALIAISIKYGVVAPLPGQPMYTGLISVTTRNSVIFIAGQQIPVSAYLDPDPSKKWPEQLVQPILSEPEPVALTIGFKARTQRQLIYRVLTRYVERLPELTEAILELRGRDLQSHPNLAQSESEIIRRALELEDTSVELALAVLLVALKYQVIDPLPGQIRYTGLIRYNPAVREVTIDNIPILPDHMAPGPSYQPSGEAQRPVSSYETLGTAPGSSLVIPQTSFVNHWSDTINILDPLLTDCRTVLNQMASFITFPTDTVHITNNSQLPVGGRWNPESHQLELNVRNLAHIRDTFIHELAHWFASVIANDKTPRMSREPFHTVHAAIIDQFERNRSLYPSIDRDIETRVSSPSELWARAFEGYFYLKTGHEGSCRIFDTETRPPMLRNLAFWDRDEFAKYIFPTVEDIFVRARLVQ